MSDNNLRQPSYTVTLTEQELTLAIAGLYELPMKLSAGLAMKLQQLRTPAKQAEDAA